MAYHWNATLLATEFENIIVSCVILAPCNNTVTHCKAVASYEYSNEYYVNDLYAILLACIGHLHACMSLYALLIEFIIKHGVCICLGDIKFTQSLSWLFYNMSCICRLVSGMPGDNLMVAI